MKSHLYLTLALSAFLASCAAKQEPAVQAPVEEAHETGLIIGDPVDCGIPDLLLFPIGTSYRPIVYSPEEKVSGAYKTLGLSSNAVGSGYYMNDRYASMEWVNGSAGEFDLSNILFYDKRTGESHPLHTDTLHILSFAIHNEFDKPLILFRMVRNDYNQDTVFNSLDPVMLFVSQLNGDSLVQVTPTGQRFIDYHYYKDTQTLLAKTMIDSDSSGAFEDYDETNFVEVKLKSPAMGKDIFQQGIKDMLKQQIGIK